MKNTGDFRYATEAFMCNHQFTLFAVSKDKWNAKEDTGKSLKNALHILQYAKGTSRAEVTSKTVKKSSL